MRMWGFVCLVVAAACGDIVKSTDAGGDDGGGSADAPPPGPITVHVRANDGSPDLGANVLVMTDAGDVVYDGLVDATGKVTVDLASTGWVTSRSIEDTATVRYVRMTTVRGVEPSDEIWLGPPARIADNQIANSNRAFSFTRYSTNAEHTIYVPCGNRYFASTNTATSGMVPINDACVPATFSLLAVATLQGMKFFSYVPNQSRAATSTIVVPTPWTNFASVNASFSHVPSGMEYFSGTRYTLLDDVPTLQAQVGVADPSAGGSISMSFPYPPGVGTGAMFSMALGNQTTGERQWVNLRTSTPTSTIGFDFATLDLPRLLSVPTQTTDGASWTETAGTFTPDVRVVRWNGHFSDGTQKTDVHWDIIDGEHATSITLPTLPPSYAAYDPRKLANFRTAGDNWVYYVDCDMITSYRAARPLNLSLINTFLDFKAELGGDYRCRVSESAYNDAQ